MSRTRLTVVTAVVLVALSAAVFVTRRATGGVDAGSPPGASSWEVTVTARGKLDTARNATVTTAGPPSFRRQSVTDETWASEELVRIGAKVPHGDDTAWKRRPSPMPAAAGPYRITYTFRCVLGARRETAAMRERTAELDAPPGSDKRLVPAPRIETDDRQIQDTARDLTAGATTATDQVRALHDHVLSLPYREAGRTGGALDCLENGGDDAGRSRLLVALCRNRDIPARVMTGFVLHPDAPPALHSWAEAFIRAPDGPGGRWLPACPTYGHFGDRGWPANYLIVRLDDEPVVKGAGDPQVTLFARSLPDRPEAGEPFVLRFWRAVSLAALPPAERHLVRFLLLLPIATVVVGVFRVVIGVRTYGVFSPALLGLIFRDLHALPWGLGIFTGTLLVGWVFRKVLDRYNLLLIPRAAVMLALIIGFLVVVVVVTSRLGVHVTGYVALFPLIILTHMVERFWTVEAEDGTRSSFKTLGGTMLVAVAVALALSPDAVSRWMFRYPETLGAVVAFLFLLGRYTGYRLTELYRFQDVLEFPTTTPPALSVSGEPAASPAGPEPVATPVPGGAS